MNYPMKYTICGFNQQKLFDYKLDINDAQILRWLIDFAATGKMRKLIENNTVYYLVNYEAIICAFPIMGITSTKAIANRFEKYVNCGLLQKTVRKGGSFSGTATLFAITSLVGDMIYDEKTSQTEQKAAEKSESRNTETSDKNQTSYRKEKEAPAANTDKNQTSYRDKNQTFCRTGTKLPVALKNSSVNSSDINSSSSLEEEKEALYKYLSQYVNPDVFSEDFIPKLHKKLKEFDIISSEYESFVTFAWNECNQNVRDKTKLLSYLYRTVCDNYFITRYLEFSRTKWESEQKTEKKIECPVCGSQHNYFESCSNCGLKNFQDPLEIQLYKKIFNLPEFEKKQMKKELEQLSLDIGLDFSPQSIERLNLQKEQIYKKYIKIPHEEFIKVFG